MQRITECIKPADVMPSAILPAMRPPKIDSIIDAQTSRQQRLSSADDMINNSGSTSKLAEQIKKLHNLYISKCES